MLDVILDQVKNAVGGELTQKFGLNDEEQKESVALAGSSVIDVFKEEVSKGNLTELMGLMHGDTNAASGVFKQVGAKYVSSLVGKLGVDEKIAQQISDYVIPVVVDTVGNKLKTEGASGIMSMVNTSAVSGLFDTFKGGLPDDAKEGLDGALGKLGGLGGFFK